MATRPTRAKVPPAQKRKLAKPKRTSVTQTSAAFKPKGLRGKKNTVKKRKTTTTKPWGPGAY